MTPLDRAAVEIADRLVARHRGGKPAGHCSHCHDDPSARTVADALDDAVGHLRDMLLRALATTAPETGPTAPQTDEQTQVRGDSRTEASAGADGPWSDAWCRTQLQRLSIAASEQYGLRWRDYDVVGAVIEELATLHARNREWEQTLGDLAARCDSGDIPIRLGERYSVAVLREIDRLRAALNSQGGSR